MHHLAFIPVAVGLLLARPSAADPPLTAKETTSAEKLHKVKCAKCHRLYEPRDYSEGEWRKWMASMSLKSKLKPAQAKLLTRYLDAFRAEGKSESVSTTVAASSSDSTSSPPQRSR